MHAKFNLNPGDETWENYLGIGQCFHDRNKNIVQEDLDKFKDIDNTLQAQEIINNWFPSVKADVFLSHSHKDEKLIIGLAGWLRENFGIRSFIDSAVWGYSDDLLKLIDDGFCKNKSNEYYDYSKRNRSTSHVHMMLSTALADMIDRCECVIFVNTPNAFNPEKYLKNEGKTESPWIYSEIAMTRMIRERTPEEHRLKPAMDAFASSQSYINEADKRELKIYYDTDLLHLTPLSCNDLMAWKNEERGSMREACALDSLYKMKRKQYGE
ncbi:hypothetical protein [Microvirgula aerodenitrificans]|uniref:hypothetical protein n=1 Tax=Microvirgula aerodenitrificans TaxID=57480 RepID=UPI002F425A63